MASSAMDPIFSEAADPYIFTAIAVLAALWLLNKLLSTNPKMVAESKPFGKLDANGCLWASATVGECKTTPLAGIATVYDIMQHGIKNFGPHQALGKRPLLERFYEVHGRKEVEKCDRTRLEPRPAPCCSRPVHRRAPRRARRRAGSPTPTSTSG